MRTALNKVKKCNIIDECFVCYNTSEMYYTNCNYHYICIDCSLKLFEKVCPMCRQ